MFSEIRRLLLLLGYERKKVSTKQERPKEQRWRDYVYSRFAIKNGKKEIMEDEPGSELSNFSSFKKNN